MAMKWSNIDWVNSRYHVKENLLYSFSQARLDKTKTDYSTNLVDLTQSSLEALKIHQKNQAIEREQKGDKYNDLDIIFANRNGKPFDRSDFARKIFLPALRKAGLRRIRIHDLRHTCAALLIHQQESPKYIQRQMRHASIDITFNTYGHLFEDVHREATKRLDRTIFGE